MARPKVLVAGATGYLGKYVIRALHREGYAVRALARDPERLADTRQLCTDIVVAEATDPKTLNDVIGDSKVLFSSLGKHDFKRNTTAWDIDYQANMNLLERAKAAGIEHIVFVSVLNGPRLKELGVASAKAREGVVEAIQASGIAWTILRPSGFFNDMADFFNMAARGTAWIVGDGSARLTPVHGADLADFAVQCIGDPAARGRAFDVGGPDSLTYRAIVELAFHALGKPVRTRRVPDFLLRFTPRLVGLFNPFVADLIRAVAFMSKEGAEAPCFGTHHLADFYAELAAKQRGSGSR